MSDKQFDKVYQLSQMLKSAEPLPDPVIKIVVKQQQVKNSYGTEMKKINQMKRQLQNHQFKNSKKKIEDNYLRSINHLEQSIENSKLDHNYYKQDIEYPKRLINDIEEVKDFNRKAEIANTSNMAKLLEQVIDTQISQKILSKQNIIKERERKRELEELKAIRNLQIEQNEHINKSIMKTYHNLYGFSKHLQLKISQQTKFYCNDDWVDDINQTTKNELNRRKKKVSRNLAPLIKEKNNTDILKNLDLLKIHLSYDLQRNYKNNDHNSVLTFMQQSMQEIQQQVEQKESKVQIRFDDGLDEAYFKFQDKFQKLAKNENKIIKQKSESLYNTRNYSHKDLIETCKSRNNLNQEYLNHRKSSPDTLPKIVNKYNEQSESGKSKNNNDRLLGQKKLCK